MSKKKPTSFQNILNELNIDETFTKAEKNQKKEYNSIADNIPPEPDYNMMADLLTLPTAQFGYKFLFVIVDLATKEFDMEQMKTKTPEAALSAMKKCFERNYIKKPYASLKTDGGGEFKGVFQKYLYDESILHKTTMPDRHSQLAMIDSLCRQIGRLINGYLNTKSLKAGKYKNDWLKVLPTIREKLNEYRTRNVKLPKNPDEFEYPLFDNLKEVKKGKKTKFIEVKPIYNIGDMVYRKLDAPRDVLGQKLSGNFRMGDVKYDTTPRKIINVFYMGGRGPLYRFYLEGFPNVSYPDSDLKRV